MTTPRWTTKSRLPRAAQATLDELVRTIGDHATAKRLGVSIYSVTGLAHGGCARSDTVQRVEAAIASYAQKGKATGT